MNLALAVGVGGALGAPLRYLIDLWVQERHTGRMPWGTFCVNVIGTFVLGVVLGLVSVGGLADGAAALLGTGLCGALTTYSTFSVEAVRLMEDGRARVALAYVALSLTLGILACLAGWSLALLLA
jgi:fluoride exporter